MNRKTLEQLHHHKYDWKVAERHPSGLCNACFICGMPATEREHWPPISKVDEYESQGGGEYLLLPICKECNGLASDKLDSTLWDRVERVKDEIAKKYKITNSTDLWEDEELEEIGKNLRSYIVVASQKQKAARERVDYYRGVELILDQLKF